MMDPEEDYITIAATEQQTSAKKASRKKELEDAHANLKGPSVLQLRSRPSLRPSKGLRECTIKEF